MLCLTTYCGVFCIGGRVSDIVRLLGTYSLLADFPLRTSAKTLAQRGLHAAHSTDMRKCETGRANRSVTHLPFTAGRKTQPLDTFGSRHTGLFVSIKQQNARKCETSQKFTPCVTTFLFLFYYSENTFGWSSVFIITCDNIALVCQMYEKRIYKI